MYLKASCKQLSDLVLRLGEGSKEYKRNAMRLGNENELEPLKKTFPAKIYFFLLTISINRHDLLDKFL